MSVYFVEGHLGSGKSLQSVGRLIDYAERGRRIAGNIDINLEKLTGSKWSKTTYMRLPDRPTADDLFALGQGSDSRAEDTFGALVLDECATFLNVRDWNQKGRNSLVDWLVHARKLRWDVFIIIQSVEALDNQIKNLLLEYRVQCYRLDKLRIPIIGGLLNFALGIGRLPKIFIAGVYYGRMAVPIKADRWVTTGKRVFECYDTEQVLLDLDEIGTYSQLSPWHTTGRYEDKPSMWEKWIYPAIEWPARLLMFAALVTLGGWRKRRAPIRQKPLQAMDYFVIDQGG